MLRKNADDYFNELSRISNEIHWKIDEETKKKRLETKQEINARIINRLEDIREVRFNKNQEKEKANQTLL